jgi:hypothetical protein
LDAVAQTPIVHHEAHAVAPIPHEQQDVHIQREVEYQLSQAELVDALNLIKDTAESYSPADQVFSINVFSYQHF